MAKRYIDDLTKQEQYELLLECKEYQIKKYGQDWLDEIGIYLEKNTCPRCGEKFASGISSYDETGYCNYQEEIFECERCDNQWYLMLIYPDHKEFYMYGGYISWLFCNLYFTSKF